MKKKKAKVIFKHNSFDIVENGDYVVCAVSGREIMIKDLTYWNVICRKLIFPLSRQTKDIKS